jgi:hypothetical protein
VPRLVGKQSNEGLYAGVVLIAAVLVAGSCEYFGVVNVVPGFGSETNMLNRVLMHNQPADSHSSVQR